jgi:hypothetical protein
LFVNVALKRQTGQYSQGRQRLDPRSFFRAGPILKKRPAPHGGGPLLWPIGCLALNTVFDVPVSLTDYEHFFLRIFPAHKTT